MSMDGEIMKNIFKKLWIPALMVLTLLCVSPVANAADYPFVYEARNNGVIIVSCTPDYEGDVVIPEKIDNVNVVEISDGAFINAEGVTSVKLPSTLKTIGTSAFEGCVTIKEIAIPDSVTSVGESAFASCASLEKVSIGKGINALSKGMFEGCTALNGVTLPENIKAIGEYAFSCCDKLETIALYPHITSIGNYAFYDCDSLAKIALPETVTVIGEGVFAECEKLTSISIQKTLTAVEALAFDGCGKLTVYYAGDMGVWAHVAIDGEGNDALTDATFSAGHKHEDKEEVLTEPTCTKKGLGNYSCVCGYVYKKEIPALGHNSVDIPSSAATCTAPGTSSGKKCSRCDAILAQPQIVPALGHKEVIEEAVDPTCVSEGKTSKRYCEVCGEVFVKAEIIEKKPHNVTYELTKATTSKNGEKILTCKDCGNVEKKTIYNVSQFKLEATTYVYNGKSFAPAVTVADSADKLLEEGTDYTVSYPEDGKSIGVHSIKIKLKGDYSGSKTLKFTVTPGKTSKITPKATNKSVALTWNAVEGATGYRVYVYKSVSSKTRVKLASVTGKTAYTALKDYNGKALKAGETYKFAIQAYKKFSDGTVVFAKNGVAITVTLPPATPSTLKVTAAGSGKVNLSWTNVSGEDGYTVYYATSKNGKYKKLDGTKADVVKLTAKLTKGNTYYFKVRAYAKGTDGNVRSAFSPIKSVKVK